MKWWMTTKRKRKKAEFEIPTFRIFGLALFLFAPPLWAEPEFHVAMDRGKSVKAGQVLQLDIEAAWRTKEGDYRFLVPSLQLENLSLEESGETNETFEKEGEEWRRKAFRFRLRALEKGHGRIRPFQVGYVNPETATRGHFEAGELEISIVPDRTRRFQVASGVTFLGLGIFGTLQFLRRRKKEPLEALKEPTLEERYLIQLNKEAEKISEAGRIFRAYLTEKFSLSRGRTTPKEILGLLKNQSSPEELKKLRKIFDKLDECQFGTAERSGPEHRQLHQEMTHFVEGKRII